MPNMKIWTDTYVLNIFTLWTVQGPTNKFGNVGKEKNSCRYINSLQPRCCQPYRIGHGGHPNLKTDLDGWMVPLVFVNTGSCNGLLPDGTKPLPEPMRHSTRPRWVKSWFRRVNIFFIIQELCELLVRIFSKWAFGWVP